MARPVKESTDGQGVRHRALWLPVVLGLLWGGLILGAPLSHDEHMYVGAGMLARRGTPYVDFAYLQAPYLAYVYGLLFAMSGESFLLLKTRLLSLVACGVATWCVYALARRASNGRDVGLLCAVWFATHHLTLFSLPYARALGIAMVLSLVWQRYLFFVRLPRRRRLRYDASLRS